MIQVFLDTETTGIDPSEGHRIIELGATVVEDGMHTGEEFHELLNPERDVDVAATEVHGFTLADLADQPRFEDIVERFVAFISGREVFIHNANFDVPFLDSEFARAQRPERMATLCTVTDTMELAKRVHKTGQVNLDTLCNKHGVDRSDREKHGALLDAQLLAEVYLRMLEASNTLLGDYEEEDEVLEEPRFLHIKRDTKLVVRATPADVQAHEAYLAKLAAP